MDGHAAWDPSGSAVLSGKRGDLRLARSGRGASDSRVRCYGLRDQIGILSDGTIVPCCLDHEGDLALGNIFRDDPTEILQSPRACAIRDGFLRGEAAEDLCRRCGYARR